MGLFERFRNNDSDEVELRPAKTGKQWDAPRRGRRRPTDEDGEVELRDPDRPQRNSFGSRPSERSEGRSTWDEEEDDDDDGFILPGMKSASSSATESSTGSGTRSTGSMSPSGSSRDVEDRIERLLQQNEKIIDLLEEIARGGRDGWARDRQ